MEEIDDIPQYFICPISLQIMKDPVTTVSGISYDRESIEKWLNRAAGEDNSAVVCPVTKQHLPRDFDLTPNHSLRRFIKAWCIANDKTGLYPIPTPKSPVRKAIVFKLIRDLRAVDDGLLHVNALKKLEELAGDGGENKRNGRCMAEAGVPKAVVLLIFKKYREGKILGMELAFRILDLTWIPENKQIVEEDLELFIKSVLWVLNSEVGIEYKNNSAMVMKKALEVVDFSNLVMDSFYTEILDILKRKISPQVVKAVLQVLLQSSSSSSRHKMKIVEAGGVFEIIELELNYADKKTTELAFSLLAQMCTCADGRDQFLRHPGGVALAAKRLLRVSPLTDERALCVIGLISHFSATNEVVLEMLRVGAVAKLCMLLQADSAAYLKKKASGILRSHNNCWSSSPCIQLDLIFSN